LLCRSQTKKYVNVLIELGLVEREHFKKKLKDKGKDFESESFYKVKRITEKMIHKMDSETKLGAIALLEVINYKLGKELI
jgi:predicted transcriptional regulator